jgi:hypothetical protein
MFLKIVVTTALAASLLGAAEPSRPDIFSVRSFLNPETKAKIAVSGQLFSDGRDLPEQLLRQTLKDEAKRSDKCAIPLTQVKAAKTHDHMTQFAGPIHDSAGVMPPPLPACKDWK